MHVCVRERESVYELACLQRRDTAWKERLCGSSLLLSEHETRVPSSQNAADCSSTARLLNQGAQGLIKPYLKVPKVPEPCVPVFPETRTL